MTIVITCEHGGNHIPKPYQQLFDQKVLETHRGYDIGALELAKMLSKYLKCPFFYSTTSRLLVDLNRSLTNKTLFSEFTNSLPENEKIKILEKHYFPYREKVEKFVSDHKKVIHLSIHSFTPILKGKKRDADIGLLYDPKRDLEKKFCDKLFYFLNDRWIVRRNYPYKGTSDGLTTHLRSVYGANKYIGIEIEANQKFPLSCPKEWNELQALMALSLKL